MRVRAGRGGTAQRGNAAPRGCGTRAEAGVAGGAWTCGARRSTSSAAPPPVVDRSWRQRRTGSHPSRRITLVVRSARSNTPCVCQQCHRGTARSGRSDQEYGDLALRRSDEHVLEAQPAGAYTARMPSRAHERKVSGSTAVRAPHSRPRSGRERYGALDACVASSSKGPGPPPRRGPKQRLAAGHAALREQPQRLVLAPCAKRTHPRSPRLHGCDAGTSSRSLACHRRASHSRSTSPARP